MSHCRLNCSMDNSNSNCATKSGAAKSDFFVVMFTENLSASKIVSIKDLRNMLQKSPEDHETTQQTGLGTTQQARDHGTAKESTRSTPAHFPPVSSAMQVPFSSPAKLPQVTAAPSLATRSAAPSVEGSIPAGTLASLLQSSQAAEAKAYFTGLLPGNAPLPRPISQNASKPPAASTGRAGTVPSFTGFTGKLGPAANGSVKFDFSAVRVFCCFVVGTFVPSVLLVGVRMSVRTVKIE